jgi:hypothetical protein
MARAVATSVEIVITLALVSACSAAPNYVGIWSTPAEDGEQVFIALNSDGTCSFDVRGKLSARAKCRYIWNGNLGTINAFERVDGGEGGPPLPIFVDYDAGSDTLNLQAHHRMVVFLRNGKAGP